LVAHIGPGYPKLELVANLGVNGFTSRDVIEAELPALAGLRPDYASLLIGVNDVVQGVAEDVYRANVVLILDDLLARIEPARIVVVTIPDYTVTPAGADFGDVALRSASIRRFNAIMEDLTRARSIALVDIYDISLEAATDRSLVAVDGLHPSGAQYRRWVEEIKVVVEDQLAP
jgi:lysophospholipase L1-like esterase